ncbi:PREDICTED: uncharacterized protein LOC109587342 [Amphimedon queenslandica]|uniref:Uncharacterized protein n=1 Tax=Amphimedon queenslandica TaxID=400682 RepID=A0AAN0JQ31_AMPQE|nr:PREDICTED: uncharacterized protein LOC109587342 [Amphimedon queenslandica]|eukprot:XP_019859144.1 PREDICTED: uncharacterized protein LOC109587342 [Amphimedon queenslandica]
MIDGSSSSFQLLSSVDADPPVFSLSFNVTNRSPTIVTCSVDNGNQFNVSDSDLIRTVTPVNNDVQVQVSVIFRMRVSSLYKCFVTTDRIKATPLVSTNMIIRNDTVTGSPSTISPSNLVYSRDSLLSVTLGWSPSAVISATPQYHVFVNNSNGIIMNDDTTNITNTDSTLSVPLISAIVSVNNSNGIIMNDNTTNITNTDSTLSVPLISAIVSVLIIIVALVLIIICAVCVIICRKKSKMHNINSKTDDIDVTPNAGYGMINTVKNTATGNENNVYERIGDDQVYEQLDEPHLLVARESAADKNSTSVHEKENEENVYI